MNELEKKADNIARSLLNASPNIIDPITILAIISFITEGVKLWQQCNTGTPTTNTVGTLGRVMLKYKAMRVLNRYNISAFGSTALVNQTLVELGKTSQDDLEKLMKLINN